MPEASEHSSFKTPPGAVALLSALIHETTGILFEPEREDLLVQKLAPLLEEIKCSSYLDLYYLLKYRENGNADWERVMDVLSVPETYFWREMGQVDALVRSVAPAWFKRTPAPLRIWSAGCATGEEPLTILMALLEAGFGGHTIEIHGSDASAASLHKARQGFYREKSFRCLPHPLRARYFTPVPGGWQVNPELARKITYHRANLQAREEIESLARFPIIFCRNVFIYFSRHAIRQTLATFAARMPSGGILFIGATESLLKLTVDFELREIHGAFAYYKI